MDVAGDHGRIQRPSAPDARQLLRQFASEFPPHIRDDELSNLDRAFFHLTLIGSQVGYSASICDLGAGFGVLPLICAILGMDVTVIDSFLTEPNAPKLLEPYRNHGVRVLAVDSTASNPVLAAGSLDAVVSFDAIEHFHSSPKRFLHLLLQALRPGGSVIISAPNCVDLDKRVRVTLGIAEWSSMGDWYERPQFTGHVREPSLADLRYIASDLGLEHVRTFGKNHWPAKRYLGKLGRLLEIAPSLCSTIYLIGHKPLSGPHTI